MRVHYAQCWEDPRTLMQALEVTPEDDVVSIASGGDNAFALLLSRPRSLTVVDWNPAQIFLVELKMRAMEKLDYEEFVGFVGARLCQRRDQLYSTLRPLLSEGARNYWDKNSKAIRKGIIHCGKFENYFKIFRRMIMPLIHSRKSIRRLLGSATLEEQERFYSRIWNNRRWHGLFHIFFGKFLLGHLGRDPSFFRYVTLEKIAEVLLNRTKHGLTEVPIRENYFIEYILTGRYGKLELSHPYLQASNFQVLKENLGRLRLVCASLEEYLKTLEPGTVSKFNLSDIFEYMPDKEVESNLREIFHVSRDRAKLAFWTLFIPRALPSALENQMIPCSPSTEKLFFNARTFFYGSFCLWKIILFS